jgi:hypothetical protein
MLLQIKYRLFHGSAFRRAGSENSESLANHLRNLLFVCLAGRLMNKRFFLKIIRTYETSEYYESFLIPLPGRGGRASRTGWV